jgi:hypothetical protein
VALYLLAHGANPGLPSEFDAATPMLAARRAGLTAVEARLCALGIARPPAEPVRRGWLARLLGSRLGA